MIGVRVFMAYLGVVWFLLGFASTLDLTDRLKASMERADRIAEAAEERVEAFKKAAERIEEDWGLKIEAAEGQVSAAAAAMEAIGSDGGFAYTQAVEAVAVATSYLELQKASKAQAMKDAERGVEDMEEAADEVEDAMDEASNTGFIDWMRALGATFIGVLLIAFAWRGPPLAWDDIVAADEDEDAPAPQAPSAAPAAPAAPSAPVGDDDLELDIEDPSDA